MKPSRPTVLFNFVSSRPDRVTGISVYAFNVLAALGRRDACRYVLQTNWSAEHMPAVVRQLELETVRVNLPLTEKVRVPAAAATAAVTAKRVRADVVFTPDPFGAVAGGRARVFVVHDLYRETLPHLYSWHQRLFWRQAFGLAVARSQKIICVSDATRVELARLYPGSASKAVVVHEASAVSEVPDDKPPPFVAQPYGLFVANATPTKNIGCLLRALAILRDQGLSPTIYWVGRDDYGGVQGILDEVGPLPDFRPLGSVDDQTLASLYAHADFYVNASFVEGFCIPIVEAHGFGVPVVCSDIPVLREVGGEGILAFDPREPGDLASAMRALIQNRDARARLSRAASANAQRFSWEKAAAQTEDVFLECLGTRGSRAA